jgi:hypothetical protein
MEEMKKESEPWWDATATPREFSGDNRAAPLQPEPWCLHSLSTLSGDCFANPPHRAAGERVRG